ncbi:HYC_CC_PP family protein [Faecalibacter sp. LW9]|uniref:HYC_CC_PP family protein n=1 Tax=Faecalibacter sp. LW9 TaxID=3103144 RepID=UPI002AFDF396|nr:hypothetical protein [Faecalibacter sp. LW9]
MKMQTYIRVMLSLLLIVSNLGVAFSMHFCQGQVERIKLNHFDNQVCKMQMPTSCCAEKNESKHCEIPAEDKDDDCCKDLAYADELQQQHSVDVLKITPIDYAILASVLKIEIPFEIHSKLVDSILDSYVESNAPPIYILHQQLVLYEI